MSYISREEAIKAITDNPARFAFITSQQITALKKLPTADVVVVRHGHWIEHTAKPNWLEDDVEVFYNCSECGSSHWSIIPPYCPDCGAKMDGERKEK